MKIIIDCDKSMERKDLRKDMNRKKGVEREIKDEGEGKARGVETFYSLRVTSPMYTHTTAALECKHLPLQVRPLNCYFQHEL